MSKRSRLVIKTKEAEALMKLRRLKGLSVRKTADLLGVSHTLVHHLEIGRANISQRYIDNFLKTLNYSSGDWKLFLQPGQKNKKLISKKITEDCVSKLNKLSEEQLRLIQLFIEKI